MKNNLALFIWLAVFFPYASAGCGSDAGAGGGGDSSSTDRAVPDDAGVVVDAGGHPDAGEIPDWGAADLDGSGGDAYVSDGGSTDGPSHYAGTYKVGARDFDIVRKSIR